MSCAIERGDFPEWTPKDLETTGELAPILRYRELRREYENGAERECGCHHDLAVVFAVTDLNAATSPRRRSLNSQEVKALLDAAERMKALETGNSA